MQNKKKLPPLQAIFLLNISEQYSNSLFDILSALAFFCVLTRNLSAHDQLAIRQRHLHCQQKVIMLHSKPTNKVINTNVAMFVSDLAIHQTVENVTISYLAWEILLD